MLKREVPFTVCFLFCFFASKPLTIMPFYDYESFPSKDGIPGADVPGSCGKYKSMQALMQACSDNPSCTGFTQRTVNGNEIPWCMKNKSGTTHASDHTFFKKDRQW
jgi:hypothetical protein